MRRMGALLFIAIAAHALPVEAQSVTQNSAPQASLSPGAASQNRAAAQSDVTGAIDKGAQPRVSNPLEANRAAPGAPQARPTISYQEAFRNWRDCAVMHLGVGNPPPQCEPLRSALRQAIGARPRDFSTTDTQPRS